MNTRGMETGISWGKHQQERFYIFPSLPREASKGVSIFDRGTQTRTRSKLRLNRLRSVVYSRECQAPGGRKS